MNREEPVEKWDMDIGSPVWDSFPKPGTRVKVPYVYGTTKEGEVTMLYRFRGSPVARVRVMMPGREDPDVLYPVHVSYEREYLEVISD